jgi:hypothetical protein
MGLEQRIECETSNKLLARVTEKGIKLWCEKHRREELIPWERLDTLRESLFELTISNQTATITAH